MSTYTDASLIMFPSGYKEDKIYSLKPTDGSGDLTFTRASTATRVNAEGLIETSPVNFNTFSESFTSPWGTDGTSTATNNFATAPNGTTTAAKVVANTSGGYAYKNLSVSPNVYTLSLYIKASANTTMDLAINDVGGTGVGSQIFSVTTEWQRIEYDQNITAGSSIFIVYGSLNTGVDYFVWGAQLNIGSTAKPYFPTTDRLNVPRIDYTGGGCGKLLLESQRTNLALYSEQFDNAAWAKTRTTSTANSIVSPDGTQNADTITPNTTADSHLISPATLISLGGVAGTFSVFAKYNGYHLSLSIAGSSGNWTGCVFDLQNGIARTPQSAGAQSPCTAKIEDFGNGWYRCSITYTPYTSGTFYTNIGITSTNNATLSSFGLQYYAGNATSGVYLYGAQIELGSYVSSYVKTLASSVTRLADAAYKTGISSLIGQTEGTLFADIDVINLNPSNVSRIILSDGTTNNYIFLGINEAGSGNLSRLFINNFSTSFSLSLFSSTAITIGLHKLALAYKSGEFALYLDGNSVASSSATGTIPATSQIVIGGTSPSTISNLETLVLNKSILFPTRLTNAQLATLTTL